MPSVFQLVFFDIDGTLVHSGDVWGPAVQRAMREVYAERQIPLSVPSVPELEKVIGIPGHEALHPFIPPQYREHIPEISRRVGEYGPATMRAGAGRLIEGCRQTLQRLREEGAFLALASNCGNSYIREVSETMGVGELVDEAFCLDTPGVRHKADMIAKGMQLFGTRRALMVGDRHLDLQAAHANGIPFLAYSGGFGEQVEWERDAEGVIHSYAEFFPSLEARRRFLADLAQELHADGAGRSVGITGLPFSGKTHFADELAEALREKKIPVRLHRLDEFANETKVREALRPARVGEVVMLEGEDLTQGSLARSFHRTIHLEAQESVMWRRFEGRTGQTGGALADRLAQRIEKGRALAHAASLRIENSNVLAPRRLS